jgi:endonuclease/exonuclease/phosphatase family metal-dependent hydrolase
MQIKVATYNIQGGKIGTGKVDLNRAANIIKGLAVDLIALQEVQSGQEKTLAAKAGMPHNVHGPTVNGGGVAILSKFPFSGGTRNIKIPSVPGTSYAQPRALLIANAKLPDDRPLRFCSTHFGFEWAQFTALGAIADVGSRSGNTIIGGDFNSVPGSAVFQYMGVWFEPSSVLPVIDNFLLRGAITVIEHKTVPDGTPDHSPVVATLEI